MKLDYESMSPIYDYCVKDVVLTEALYRRFYMPDLAIMRVIVMTILVIILALFWSVVA